MIMLILANCVSEKGWVTRWQLAKGGRFRCCREQNIFSTGNTLMDGQCVKSFQSNMVACILNYIGGFGSHGFHAFSVYLDAEKYT